MTSPGGEWAKARVGVELDWSNVDQELRQKLERSTLIASRAAQRHLDNLRRSAEVTFTRMGQSYSRQTDGMVRNTQTTVARINAQLQRIRDVRVTATLSIDSSGALAELKRVHGTLQAWLNANPLTVRVGVDTARSMASLQATHIAMQSWLQANPLEVDVRANSRGLAGGRGGIQSLTRGITSALGSVAKWTTILAGATMAAGAALPVIAALGAALASVGVAAGGAGIAGIAAAATGFAALKTGLSGVGEAFSALGEASASGGGAAVDNAKQVRDAQRDLTNAIEDERDAQKDVGRARDDARRKLRDLDLELRGAALSEKEAAIDLADARDELARGDFKSSREKQKAVLAVQKAELRLTEIQRGNGDLIKDTNEQRRKGVEGSDEVVDAQKRLKDATESVQRAQEAVAEAQKGAAGGGGVDKAAQAMAKLSPKAREFVLAVQAVKPAWADMKREVQDSLFANLAAQMQPLTDNYVPLLGSALVGVTRGFNEGALAALGFLNSTRGLGVMSTLLGTSSNMAGNFGRAIGELIPGLAAVGAGAGQVFSPMTDGLAGATRGFSEMLIQAQESGRMADYFRDAVAVAKQFGQVLSELGSIIGGVFNAAGTAAGGNFLGGLQASLSTISEWVNGPGQTALVSFFESMTAGMGAVLPILLQLAGIIGTTIAPALSDLLVQIAPAVGGFVTALGEGLKAIAPAMAPLGAAISSIFTALGPVMPVLGQLIATFVELAGPIIGALAQALGPVLVTVGNALIVLLQALMPAVQPLSEYFVALGPVIGQLASMIGGALGAALQVIVPAMTLWWKLVAALLPVFTGLLQMLQPFTTAIGALAGAVLVAYGAFKVFRMVSTIISVVRTAWTLLSLAFTASPIGMIITAIAALAAGLYLFFTKTETGRALWDKIWGSIKATWDVVWGALKVGFEKLGEIAKWLWENALQPAFSAIGKAIGWVKDHWEIFAAVLGGPIGILVALQSKFGVVSTVIQALGTVITWLWQNVIQPAFSFIGTIIGGVWNVVKFIFNSWMTIFRAVGAVVMWLWNNVVTPAFNAIKTIITTWWSGVQIVFGFFRDILVTVGGWVWDMVGKVVGFFTTLATGIRDKATLAKDWVVEKFNLVIDFFRGLPATMRDLAGKIWDPIKNAAKTVFNSIARLWNNTVGKVNFTVPDWIPAVGGKKFAMPQIPTFAYGGTVRGKGTGTSDSILSWLSNGEFVSPAHAVNARTLPLLEAMRSGWTPPAWLTGAALGSGLPGFAGGGPLLTQEEVARMGGGTVNRSLAEAVRRQFPDVKITSAKTDHFDDGGYHPKGMALDLDNRDDVAAWLFANRKALDLGQIIYGGGDGQWNYYNIGGTEASGKDAIPIYGSDVVFGQHSDHIHTMANKEVPATALGAGPRPGFDTGTGTGTAPGGLGGGGGASTPIGSGLGASWGNSGGQSAFNSAAEADKGGVIPVWVENWPASLGGGGGGAGAPASLGGGDPSALPAAGGPAAGGGAAVPAGAGIGKLTRNSSKQEVADAIYWEARKRGYSHEEAIAILAHARGESDFDPEAVSDNGLWHGVFQQDSSYPGRDDPNKNIGEFFNRLDAKRKSPGASNDIWKNIFWLQQRPGESSADAAFSNGRQEYLTAEMKPHEGEARRLADEAAKRAPAAPAPAPAPAPDPTATPTDVAPVTPSDTPTLTPSEDPGNGYNVGQGGDDTKKRDPQEFTIGGGTLSSQLGGLVKTALHNGIDDFIAANPGLLGNYDNTEGTSLGDRAGGVASSAISGQLGSALGVFGMDVQPPILDAVGAYMQDNPRDKGENGTATKKDLIDLAEAFLRGGPMQVIVNNPQDGDDVVRKVDQDRRRRMRRYVNK
ncbi:tape measure protein [Gordonia phage SmokingBunny]|uniref:Tape measure protein n=1 Tax=Gordonia phage SmokingBunny TaxID=2572528 RepID=A0A4D6T6Y6_9CAUD|nr:tail length tape measure protein [Gordonia phage SmokingBunny]QCG77840.1 tape measure protein [Gordonia phage SmokingBunny]WAA20247.1 tape measure protein [Gordonia phage Togo]